MEFECEGNTKVKIDREWVTNMSNKLILLTTTYSEAVKEYSEEWPEDLGYASLEEDAEDLAALCEESWGVFVVCGEEQEAARLAEAMQLTPSLREKTICLEGYEGKHYFKHCIRVGQDVEEGLFQLLDMVFLPGAINLDLLDLRSFVKGTNYAYQDFRGDLNSVKEQVKTFLMESTATGCMANIFGDVGISEATEVMELFAGFEDILFGITVLETEDNEVQLSLIYDYYS